MHFIVVQKYMQLHGLGAALGYRILRAQRESDILQVSRAMCE